MSIYDNADYIEECLDSIHNQTYFKDKENKFQILVSVDGCQKSWRKINEIKEKYTNLEAYNLYPNVGAFVSLNTILPHVRYENILIFGADDVLYEDALERLYKVEEDYDVIKFRYKEFKGSIDNITLIRNWHALGAILIKKKVFDMCGGFHENRFSSDFELMTRISKFVKILNLDEFIFYYRTHDKSLTSTVDRRVRANFDRMVNETKYTMDNIKIDPVIGKIWDKFST
tara:strand:+ start:22748 stop:23434 length:687 start_codon:yes stop_codon:yes gene_type:complete